MAKVPVVPVKHAWEIEQKAQAIGKMYPESWEGREPVPVDSIFEHDIKSLGIRPLYTDLMSQGINAHGYTDGIKKHSMINEAVANNLTVGGRRFFRSTVGHELGHCFLHVPYGAIHASLQTAGYSFQRERTGLKPWEDPEWQAWRFCKALCMPAHLVRGYAEKYGAGETGIAVMMDAFDMNYSFVLARLRDLKILPRWCYEYQRGA